MLNYFNLVIWNKFGINTKSNKREFKDICISIHFALNRKKCHYLEKTVWIQIRLLTIRVSKFWLLKKVTEEKSLTCIKKWQSTREKKIKNIDYAQLKMKARPNVIEKHDWKRSIFITQWRSMLLIKFKRIYKIHLKICGACRRYSSICCATCQSRGFRGLSFIIWGELN